MVVSALVVAVLTVGCSDVGSTTSRARATANGPRVVRGHLLVFKVVKQTQRSDVVEGHDHRFIIKRGVRKVTVRDLGPCTVVSRTARVVVLRTPVSGPLNLDGAHDLVYEGIDFRGRGSGWGDASGLIYIQGASHNITFKDCIVRTNRDGVGNGVKIVDTGAGMHDIVFEDCTFEHQPRMGFECIGRAVGSSIGYRRVDLIDCTFAASAGQAISYDDASGTAGLCTVSGTLVKGAGVGTTYQYGKVFEINGTHDMTVTGNTFYAGRDGILNLQMHDSEPCGWVFSGNVVDASRIASGIEVSSIAQPVHAENVYGGMFTDNRIINLDAWNIAYISGCHNMDWRTTEWLGPNNVPFQTRSSGNRF